MTRGNGLRDRIRAISLQHDSWRQPAASWDHLKAVKTGFRARQDLEHYLSLRPDAADAQEVEKQIAGLRTLLAMMN